MASGTTQRGGLVGSILATCSTTRRRVVRAVVVVTGSTQQVSLRAIPIRPKMKALHTPQGGQLPFPGWIERLHWIVASSRSDKTPEVQSNARAHRRAGRRNATIERASSPARKSRRKAPPPSVTRVDPLPDSPFRACARSVAHRSSSTLHRQPGNPRKYIAAPSGFS